MKTIVMKFGGASLATPEQFAQIADLIIARSKIYSKIVVVVSAMGKTTDELIALAKKVNPHPPQREYDMLVTAGERISVSLLAMALAAKQVKALSFTGSQSGIITCGKHTEARIVDVKPYRLLTCLEQGYICVVAGFQGVSQKEKEITTLGRGGSDTTAVALGIALGAEKVEFYKDVPGIFDADPKKNVNAALQSQLSYESALSIVSAGAKVLHDRCVKLAASNKLPLHVLSFSGEKGGTIISSDHHAKKPLEPIYEGEAV